MVVEVMEDGTQRHILVEKMLKGEYKKFNNNMGYVEKDAKISPDKGGTAGALNQLVGQMNSIALGAIVEGDSEEEDSDDEDNDDVGGRDHHGHASDGQDLFDKNETAAPVSGAYQNVKDEHFPQAFSHFTYEHSKRHFMVVDLQGVFTINADGSRCYELTDPCIHKHRKKNKQKFSNLTFGRTVRLELCFFRRNPLFE